MAPQTALQSGSWILPEANNASASLVYNF